MKTLTEIAQKLNVSLSTLNRFMGTPCNQNNWLEIATIRGKKVAGYYNLTNYKELKRQFKEYKKQCKINKSTTGRKGWATKKGYLYQENSKNSSDNNK
jgi:ligand-binding sensor protein